MGSMYRFRRMKLSNISEVEITMSEFLVLRSLSEDSEKTNQNLCTSEIQHKLSITRPAISQICNSLESKGYIIREIDKKDRRKILVTPTPSGETIMKKMEISVDNKINDVIQDYGEEKTIQLIELLNEFVDVLEGKK
jgi:Transcriptional regulators